MTFPSNLPHTCREAGSISSLPDSKTILTFPYTNQTQVVASVAFSPDGKFALTASGGTNVGWKNDFSIRLWDLHTLKEVKKIIGHDAGVNSVSFSNDGKYIISASMDKTLKLWKIPSGKEVRTFLGHSSYVDYVSFSSDSKFALSMSRDNTTRLWNLETSEWVAFLFAKNGIDWIVWTSDGYWDGSRNCGELVTEIIGMNVYNIDQFAVKNNRPDIILQRFETSNKEAITHYNYQFKKRIKRLGLTEAKLNNDYNVPTTKINSNTQNGKYCEINISFIDEKYLLTHYNVYVNDVPLYGSYGKTLSSQNIELTETIELTNGENKIEVSCMNEKGAESFRALTYATFNEPVKKDIYLLAFGVSKYQNPTYNLKYADKDATDLEKTIQKLKGKGFANVYTKILTNEQVTPEAIKAAKDFVKDAKPDDTFILFIAGHGMHDKDAEATYYYLTYNADVNNLKATAADFESIEDLLQGIPPRNKLFLMDACESGEIDEDEQQNLTGFKNLEGFGIASRGFKKMGFEPVETSTSTSSVAGKRPYLYQKDRYIYNDLVRRSGAIVFSSSKGGELSYERSDIENGLFTESIMKALTTTEADKDNNGVVSTDELREYVSAQVVKASGDLQHPTVDRDNIYQKFGFSIK